MQSVYFQILSPCQIHSAQRMWLREWNLAQCAFLSFSLYIYILWRILVAQWIDCWKGNMISGYSHIPASRKRRIAEVMRHLWKSSWPLCSTQGQLWSTTYCDLPWWYAGPFEQGLHIQLVCPKLAKLKVKTEHLVAQLAQVQVSSLSWSLHRNNLISSVGCGLHSKWSIDMLVEYSIHGFAGKKIPCLIFCLVFMYMAFPLTYVPNPKMLGILKNLCMLYI